jgi:serine/threonine protein kinase
MVSDVPALGPGSRVAGYRVEQQLGAGGMANVYLARHEQLGRQVALKILSPSLRVDKDFRQRFIRESRAAAKVDHPNILPIYDAGESDGWMFIAMRYAREGDVSSLLQEHGALSPELTMSIIVPIADALDAAHDAGIVHRDVKPANMLLDARRDVDIHVYLTDFGITTVMAENDLTQTGVVIGTPAYMAPEQAEGSRVDGRTDQWGLASSAFTMLGGSPPFTGGSTIETLYAIVSQPAPSLKSLRPELPSAVDAVFARAFEKSPGNRYASCNEFADALINALGIASGTGSSWATNCTPVAGSGTLPDEPPDGGPYPGAEFPARRPDSLDIPLKASFRYVHEPSRADDDALPSLGNDELIAELEKRLRHSRGGTFLITGFRGVGKSTLVMRALDELSTRSGPSDVVVPVALSVARSTTTERLLFAIVRRVFETLSDQGVLERLPSQTRHALLVSYMRTSLSYTETQTRSTQQSAGLNVGLGPGKLVKEVADIAGPQLQMSASRSKSLATEAAFLAYSETDVEYDLMRIISLVNRTLDIPPDRRSWWRGLRPRWLHRRGLIAPPRLRLVIVLDEVDKLTMDDKGMAAVEELLSGTKNVLTMSGAHFLVIAGPDLQDRAVRDAARGTGVYESVFGWRLYIPCMWDAPERLISDVVSDDQRQVKDMIEMLVHYLRFKARGVPRRLVQEVNSFVSWPDDQPCIRIGPRGLERVQFYAQIERIMRTFLEGSNRTTLFPVALDEDRWRLGSYFVVDWILQSEGNPFTAADLFPENDDASFDPLLRISRRSIDRLLDHLADHEILEIVRSDGAMNTVVADVKESTEKVFRLSREIQRILYGLAERWDKASALPLTPATGPRQAGTPPVLRMIAGRYEIGDIISQGSLSTVFKGRDVITGQQVAVKLLLTALADDAVALARFRREAEISRKLNHPQVVHTYAFIDGPDDFVIITERLVGQTLQEVVQNEGIMSPGEVAGMGQVLASALTYLADQQVVRLDLKPGNIIMADRGPVIAELGIALVQDTDAPDITVTGMFVGTPAFMAPELFTGNEADRRSDIYSLGLVMHYCLAGKHPWEDLPHIADIGNAVLNERIYMSGLGISQQFQAVLERATARRPDDRFPDAAALGDALRQTPEWQALGRGPEESETAVTLDIAALGDALRQAPEWPATRADIPRVGEDPVETE